MKKETRNIKEEQEEEKGNKEHNTKNIQKKEKEEEAIILDWSNCGGINEHEEDNKVHKE